MNDYRKSLVCFFKVFKKLFFVSIVFIDVLLIIAPVDNMKISARIFDSQRPCHLIYLAVKFLTSIPD